MVLEGFGMEIFGYIGCFLSAVAFFPQVWQVYRSRSAEGVSSVSYGIVMASNVFWTLYALPLSSIPMFLTNGFMFSAALSLLIAKVLFKVSPSKEQSQSSRQGA